MTVTEALPVRGSTGSADDIDHLWCCCSPVIAICGADIEGAEECPEDCGHPQCERCAALCEVPCILCGHGVTGPCACGKCP